MVESVALRCSGEVKRKAFENVLQKACSVICSWCYFLMRKRGNFAVSKVKYDEQILFISITLSVLFCYGVCRPQAEEGGNVD